MNKFWVRLLTFWIFPREYRKKAQMFLTSYHPWHDNFSILRFLMSKIGAKRVLIIEPNEFHGEVLPGLVKYWLDLGFKADVMITNEVAAEKPLFLIKNKRLRIFPVSTWSLRWLLKSHKIEEYEFIMLNSSIYRRYEKSFLEVVPLDGMKDKILIMEHDVQNIGIYNEEYWLMNNRLLTLKSLPYQQEKTLMVNSHYFGAYRKHKKNEVVNFIVVGGICPERKNHKLLFAAVDKLLEEGIIEFKITVVGMGRLRDIPQKYHRYLDIKGRLGFPALCREMHKADFILPLLDADSKEHERYITTGVTGTMQLVLGFAKPCLIEEKFAAFYEIDEANGLVYQHNELHKAMLKAYAMADNDYVAMRKLLREQAEEIADVSQANLLRAITKR